MCTLSGFAFGVLLMLSGFASAGFGHGTYLPIALGAAPVSLIPVAGLFAAPVWWGAIGALADRRWLLAVLVVLAVHTVACVGILWLGTPMEPGNELWRYFWRAMRVIPTTVTFSLVVYAAGLGLAWVWTLGALATSPAPGFRRRPAP